MAESEGSSPRPIKLPKQKKILSRVDAAVPELLLSSEDRKLGEGRFGKLVVEKATDKFLRELDPKKLPGEQQVRRSEVVRKVDSGSDDRSQLIKRADEANEMLIVFDDGRQRDALSAGEDARQAVERLKTRVENFVNDEVMTGDVDIEKTLVATMRSEGKTDQEIAKHILEQRVQAGEKPRQVLDAREKLRHVERSKRVRQEHLRNMMKASREMLTTDVGGTVVIDGESHVVTGADKAEALKEMQKVADMIAVLEERTLELTQALVDIAGDELGPEKDPTTLINEHKEELSKIRNAEVVAMPDESEYITSSAIEGQLDQLVEKVGEQVGELSDEARAMLMRDLGIVKQGNEYRLTENSIMRRKMQAGKLREQAQNALEKNLNNRGKVHSVESAYVALNAMLTAQGLEEICQAQEVKLAGLEIVEQDLSIAEALGQVDRYNALEHVLHTSYGSVREQAQALTKQLGEFFKGTFSQENMKKLGRVALIAMLIALVGSVVVAGVGVSVVGSAMQG